MPPSGPAVQKRDLWGTLKSRQQKGGFWLGSLQAGRRQASLSQVGGQRPESGLGWRAPAPGHLQGEGSPAAAGHPSLLVLKG